MSHDIISEQVVTLTKKELGKLPRLDFGTPRIRRLGTDGQWWVGETKYRDGIQIVSWKKVRLVEEKEA